MDEFEFEEGKRGGPAMIKQLASCSKPTRDKALRFLLNTWLPTQKEISDDDMKKLWKGLFYCVWHADKLSVQAQLIERLSSLLPSLDLHLSLHYFSVFLLTMRREWSGIDHLRLDKFYLLMRKFLHYFFLIFRKNSWDLELSKTLMALFMDKAFLWDDDKICGDGVNYHITSIFMEELRPFLPLSKEVIELIFKPFVAVMAKVQDKVLLGKIKSNVFQVLLKMGSRLLEMKKSGSEIDSDDDVVIFGTVALVMGFSSKLFDLGSSVECFQGNRKVLFSLYEEFLKLERELESSNLGISNPEIDIHDEEDEVLDLVPISYDSAVDASEEGVAEASANRVLKKCKKAKNVSSGNVEKEKKPKKKKKAKNALLDYDTESSPTDEEEEGVISTTCGISNEEQSADASLISLDETLKSNLQLQFEKAAAEMDMDNNVNIISNLPKVAANGTVSKKRKRVKSIEGQQLQNSELTNQDDAEDCQTAKSEQKSAKKVRFSMKNNLVWKPQSPLPPQSLRLPPSVTPRGSALKKGVPPGPIREMPLAVKKMNQRKKSVKKARKVLKIINPTLKSVKKLKSRSTF